METAEQTKEGEAIDRIISSFVTNGYPAWWRDMFIVALRDARAAGVAEGLERAATCIESYDIYYDGNDVSNLVPDEIRALIEAEKGGGDETDKT